MTASRARTGFWILLAASAAIVLAAIVLPGGPALAETHTASWDPVTTYTDNTPIEAGKTVMYTLYWTTDAALSPASLRTIVASTVQTSATFDPDVQAMPRGQTVYFTVKTVLSTGEESALAPAYAWLVPASGGPPVLTGVTVSGPSSVNEGGTATYTATALWSDNTTTTVAAVWSVSPSTYASISSSGVLTAGQVTSSQTVTVTASYTSGGVTKSGSKVVTIADVPPVLTGVTVSGPSSVNEGGTATYTATALWSDNTTTTVAAVWSVSPSTYASISSSGVLTAGQVTSSQTVTVTASYTSGGVTKSGSKVVTIADVPVRLPAAPKNLRISGPVQTSPTEKWELAWDAVETYADGAPLEAGRTVRYTAYWSARSDLGSPAVVGPSGTTATSVQFDPVKRGMVPDSRVYFAAKAVLDTGADSGLSVPVSWVVSNPGPAPPVPLGIIKTLRTP